MTKSIFVGEKYLDKSIKKLRQVNANHYFVDTNSINKHRWSIFKSFKAILSISINSFDQGGCPLDPKAVMTLKRRIDSALKWHPDEIWFDHFRFDGHWEAVMGKKIPGIHTDCKWCNGINRADAITKLARHAVLYVSGTAKTGYFAVPFKKQEIPELITGLGQNHKILSEIFDKVSPMLYHRMIKKPISYISEYIKYFYKLNKGQVLPIIQIKDMPDDLEDKLDWKEFKHAFDEAKKKPSSGVSIFYWTHAVEKGKIEWIKKVFKTD